MDRIIYPQPGGPIAVILSVQIERQPGESERDALLRHARQILPEGTPLAVVAAETLPTDRSWRNAWAADFSSAGDDREPAQVTIDMELAREVHRGRLRAARAPLLAELDTAFLRAIEAGDQAAQAEIAGRKQALRDAPGAAAITTAKTPDALIASIADPALRERYATLLTPGKEAR
jgi:hypothetical protein